MKEECLIWKVFIPSNVLKSQNENILGKIFESERTVCIKNIISHVNSGKESIIGKWTSFKSINKEKKSKYCSGPWFELQVTEEGFLKCALFIDGQKKNIKTQCILYEPNHLLSSYILSNKSSAHSLEDHGMQNKIHLCQDNISNLVSFLQKFSKAADETSKSSIRVTSCGLFYHFCVFVLHPFIVLFLLFGKLFDNRYTSSGFAKTFLDGPALTRQLRLRTNNLRQRLMKKDTSPLCQLRYLDICGRQLVDSLLGIGVLIVLVNGSLADVTATGIMDWADNVARSLTDLIHWMMGAPAGLKLNSQLTHFLGHFFLYHIYLWTGYLSLLRPVLGVLLKCSSVLGVVGVSAQLCLAQDIISMMTVHIYCFYVYAARLYSIQVYGLASLWRLFRGKKWNVLRHRVDSAVYDIDQLFVGTLLFTILLFLLPTTMLYYVFFLALRLVVLVSEGILTFTIRLINHLPIYSVVMWVLRSNTVAGDVMFTVVPNSSTESSLVLTMKPTQLSLGQLLKEVNGSPLPATSTDSMATLLHKVVKGKLIYPWIDDNRKTNEKVD